MERDRQLDHTEAGAEMAAGDRHRIDCLLAQLIGELTQLGDLEPAQFLRTFNAIKQWRAG